MAATFDTGAESFDVEFNGRSGILSFVSERGLPDPFDVSAPSWAPPVLTATPAGADVVCEPVDVDVMDDVGVEEASDVVDGDEDVAELEVPVVALTAGELVDGAWLTDSVEVESGDALDGSAHAIAWLVNRTAPNPSASATPASRPTYASQRTRQLYRQR